MTFAPKMDRSGRKVSVGLVPTYYSRVTRTQTNPDAATLQEDYTFYLADKVISIVRVLSDSTTGDFYDAFIVD